MIEKDTVRLLRECDAGIKMGVSSISDMLPYTKTDKMKRVLEASKAEHGRLAAECEDMLLEYRDEGKNPNPIAAGMSKIKTTMKLGIHPSEHSIADLICDGCNMGIKSLSEYLNKYAAAEERAKDIAKKLIAMEDKLSTDMREFL